jgi:hypothetical protein
MWLQVFKEVSEDLFKKEFISKWLLMLKYFLEPLFFWKRKSNTQNA